MVTPSTQQAIENSAANAGVDSVTLVWVNENTDNAPCYDMYETGSDQNYIGSIDTDGDVIYDRR